MSDEPSPRLFSVAEANALVPELTEIFSAVRAERNRVDAYLPEIRHAAERAALGGGSTLGVGYVDTLMRIEELVDRVIGMGVMIKDMDKGLCDFLHDRDGEVVLLCWKLGEPEVAWWHGLEEGYRGRRGIEELDATG